MLENPSEWKTTLIWPKFNAKIQLFQIFLANVEKISLLCIEIRISKPLSAPNPLSAQAIYNHFVVAPCKVRFEYQARGKFCYYDLRN